MKYAITKARRFCGFLAGIIFYISAILKLLDPVGAGLVMDEYFHFLHLDFMAFSSKIIGTAFALAEACIGTALITGVWRKATGTAALIMQGFFTALTLLLVIFKPEMDCGCFGEAIHLTHMQTFLKNLVILALLAVNFIPMRGLGRPRPRKYVSFGIVTVSTLAFTVYSWIYIPLVDFTAYDATSHIQASDIYPSDEEDMYEARFVYEKDGEQKTFDLDHLPDSTWTFVSTETVLKDEFSDPSVPLSIYDNDGMYHDELAAQGRIMLISIYNPDISQSRWNEVARFISDARQAGFKAMVLIADNGKDMQVPEDIWSSLHDKCYFSDYKTLITLNRSNSGATYLSDGYIIRKWSQRNLPDLKQLTELHDEAETETLIGHNSRGSLSFQSFLLYVFAVMLLL